MPESAADYYDRIRARGDADGRLALPSGGIPYFLPPMPQEVFDENVAAVVDHLVASSGGSRSHG